jgi:hypothetical protein
MLAGPTWAKPGDNIYLLPGCSVPVGLRHIAGGGYAVVGCAYIQEIIWGGRGGDNGAGVRE